MEGDIVCTGNVYDIRNASSMFIKDGLTKSYSEEILTYTVFAFIVIVGLVANGVFIFVVYKVERMRTVMNAYLVNLAIADMIILGYGYLDRFYYYVSTPLNAGTEFLGPIYCIVAVLLEFTYYVSLFTVLMFSMERYTAVCRPMQHMKISNTSRTRLILLGTWIFAFVFATLQIPGKGRRVALCILFPEDGEYSHLSGDVHYCEPFVPFWFNAIGVPLQLLPFYAAIMGTAFFYIAIIATLTKREDSMSGRKESQSQAVKAKRSRHSATRMIVINGCVFFLCNAPIQFYVTVTWIFDIVGYEVQLPITARRNIFLVLTILLYLNSAINPFIYGLTNRQYRTALFEAIFPFSRRETLVSGK